MIVQHLVATDLPAALGVIKEASTSDIGKGAIAGAFVMGTAFLAGLAAMGRSIAAACGLFMIAAAATLFAMQIGIIAAPGFAIQLLIQSFFVGSAVVFVSAVVGHARENATVSGGMFMVALAIVSVAIANIAIGGDLARLVQAALIGGLGVAAIMVLIETVRGDHGARLILPGVILATAAVPLAISGVANPVTSYALFAAGLMISAIVGATETTLKRTFERVAPPMEPATPHPVIAASINEARLTGGEARQLRVSENQLAQVLDYTGVAVWDWTEKRSHQSASFCELMGAQAAGSFSPETMREFIAPANRAIYDEKIIGRSLGDGGFDEVVDLVGGHQVRMRGARTVSSNGDLERIVVFLEDKLDATAEPSSSSKGAALLQTAATSLAGAAAATAGQNRLAPGYVEDVRSAVQEGDIEAWFQPIVDLKKRTVVGYEALLRRPSSTEVSSAKPEGGNGDTETLLRAAKAAGVMPDLTRLMVREAARMVKAELEADKKHIFAAFNVGVSDLMSSGFAEDVEAVIKEFSLPPKSLVLEVTEADHLVDDPQIEATFKRMKAAGVALAFDDFGAGFSSLTNLYKYSFDYLKVDKSFTERSSHDAGAAKIIKAIASLGKDLGMVVIAEGIERTAISEAVANAGCDLGQGYLFGSAKALAGRSPKNGPQSASEKPSALAGKHKSPMDLSKENVVISNEAGVSDFPPAPIAKDQDTGEPVSTDSHADEKPNEGRERRAPVRRRLWASDFR